METYLKLAVQPLLKHHEKFYHRLNEVLTKVLDDHAKHVPQWLTANAVTYGRTLLLAPTLYLWGGDHHILPAILCLAVDFGDFFDGVLARWWNRQQKAVGGAEDEDGAGTTSTTLLSTRQERRKRQYGQFIDALLDKTYLIPVWIFALAKSREIYKNVGTTAFASGAGRARASATRTSSRLAFVTKYVAMVKLFVLWSLIAIESCSGYVRIREYESRSGAGLTSAQAQS